MKAKIISLVLCLSLVLGLMPVTAFAAAGADGSITISATDTSVEIGETVDVTFTVNANTSPVGSVDMNVVLPDGLEYVSHEILVAMTDFMMSSYTPATGAFGCGVTMTGKTGSFGVLKLTLRALDTNVGLNTVNANIVKMTSNLSATLDYGTVEGLDITTSAPVVAVTSVTVTPATATVENGATQQLTAEVLPANATDKNVTWSVVDGSAVTVSDTGLVTAVAEGTATVQASAGGKTDTCTITVIKATCKHTGTINHYDAKTANCKETGNIEYWECDSCGAKFKDAAKTQPVDVVTTPVDSSNHGAFVAEGEVEKVPATCTSNAFNAKVCERCGAAHATETWEVPNSMKEHELGNYLWEANQHWKKCNDCTYTTTKTDCSSTTAATCQTLATCDICDHTFGALGPCVDNNTDGQCDVCGEDMCVHTIVPVSANPKTCTTDGNIAHFKCTKCDRLYAKEDGTERLTKEQVIIPASHDLVAHAANPNSCEATGNTAYWECKAAGCGKYFSDAEGKTPIAKDSWITPVKGHDYATELTYNETNHWYACANGCGIKKDEAAHSYDQQLAEEAYLKSEATCSAKAVYYKSCVCGAKGSDTDTFEYGEIDATAHNWVEGVCSIDSKHIQMEKQPGTKVEQEIADLPATTPAVKVVTETGLEDAEDVTKIFKEGKITVEAGKLSFELERTAPVGEYYIQIGDYVVSVVVAKDEDEPERGDRPTRPSATSDAVKNVIDMIDELPSAKKVTLDDEEDIEDARKAYEKLSKADKVKVTNYDALVEAEEALEALKTDDPEVIDNPFVDVDEDAYYADPVLWAVANNITSGTSAVTFSPDAVCTRAQVVTFLWRAAGCPAPLTTEMPFVDVEAGAYYAAAVQWAVENNITAGTSATTFDPNGKCTRGQIVTFLWRAQGNPAAAAVNNFVDVEDGAYYNAPVLWAVANGITNGTSTTTFSPAADCTRAQVVTFIYRCMAE